MKKLLLIAISLMLLGGIAQARNSAATYDTKYWSQQEFVAAYNATTATMYRDFVVGLVLPGAPIDAGVTALTVNPNNYVGQYITEYTGATTDNVYVFGVVDDATIPSGQLGRICIRGPHKVVAKTNGTAGQLTPSVGQMVSQCANNYTLLAAPPGVAQTAANAINGGRFCPYTTATGTAGGALGYLMSTTATTDTGDVGVSTNAQNDTSGSEFWVWVSPQILR